MPGNLHLQNLLIYFFHSLMQRNVMYCVLRNYELLPENIENDIDMLVLPEHKAVFESCIMDSAKATGWTLLMRPIRHGYTAYWFQSDISGDYVHFDAWTKIAWKGLRWANEAEVLSRRVRRDQFYIPCASDEACISLIKDLIQVGIIKGKYKPGINSVVINSRTIFTNALQWGFGNKLAIRLCDLIERDDWVTCVKLKNSMRRSVLWQSVLRNPLEPILSVLCFLGSYMRSLVFNRTGIFVALIGPDGSGKTTIAEGLVKSMNKLFPAPLYYHGRFFFLPDLRNIYNVMRRMFGRKPVKLSPSGFNTLGNMQPHTKLRVCMYLFYYFWDYILGYWVIGNIRTKGQLLIFDRYFYDYLIQQQYAFMPKMLARLMLLLIPKPDIILYLKCEPAVIHQRKPELSVAAIKQQQLVCDSLAQTLANVFTVQTASMPQETLKIINIIIANNLKARQH